ncbi:MAG TPA: hypothetical protein VF855_14010, partial [Acidimicrobiales bacterium]
APAGQKCAPSTGERTTLTGRPSGPTRTLATADSTGRTVRWDVASRRRLGSQLVDAPAHAGFGLAWSPDGALLAETFTTVTGSGGMAFVRDLRTTTLVDSAGAKAGRNLTQTEWDRYLPGRPYQITCPKNLPPCQLSSARMRT